MLLSSLIYLQKGDQTLMLLRNKKKNDVHEGKWNGLGGKFEGSETPEECIIREVHEESGLRLKKPILNGMIRFPNFSDGIDWLVFLFTGRDFEGMLMENPPEGELHWVDNHKIFDLNLWEGDRIFLDWIFNKREFFSARFDYDSEKLTHYDVTFYPQFKIA